MKKLIAPLVLLTPLMASADVSSAIASVRTWLNALISVLFILTTLYFIWGIIEYIRAAGDEAALKKGKSHMIYGVIGMAVMAASWGIAKWIMDSFSITGGTGGVTLPQF
ncbi:MAG: hypothetical protein AAB724_02040 [Patescibacteria group bacterium]